MTLEQLAKPGGKSKVRLLSHNTKEKKLGELKSEM